MIQKNKSNTPSKIGSAKYIFLDNNVIQYSSDKNRSKSQAFINLFDDLKNQGFDLAISEITLLENLHGLYGRRYDKAYNYLAKLVRKTVSEEVLLFASKLGGLYNDEGYQNIDVADKILAATTFLEKGFIITRNHKDFPSPFFEALRWIPVGFKISGRYKNTIDLCLYQPRYKLISRRVSEKDKINS